MTYERYLNEFRNLTVDDLAQVQSAIDKVLEDRRSEEIENLREDVKRKAETLGIDPAVIFSGLVKKKRSRKPIVPKYRITEQDGTVHEWSGRGLRPKIFQNYSKEELESRFRI